MKSIGFFNNKGGVGKTTLLCNLASILAIDYKKKILVIDADPQCNASAYILPENQLMSIYDQKEAHLNIDSIYNSLIVGTGYQDKLPEIVRSERFELDLIVGSPKLSLLEDFIANEWIDTRNGEPRGFLTSFVFRKLLSSLSKDYDYIFIDMGPSLGSLNRSILLSIDYFLMPLSVDIFSLMAIDNILQSVQTWKSQLERSLAEYIQKHPSNESFKIDNTVVEWNLNFLGYVTQQYIAKFKSGVRQPVQAYERIIASQDKELNKLCDFFNVDKLTVSLGEIPTLSSVIPLSQQAHAPIFMLGSSDGIVGSHYTRVSEAREYFQTIAKKFINSVEQ